MYFQTFNEGCIIACNPKLLVRVENLTLHMQLIFTPKFRHQWINTSLSLYLHLLESLNKISLTILAEFNNIIENFVVFLKQHSMDWLYEIHNIHPSKISYFPAIFESHTTRTSALRSLKSEDSENSAPDITSKIDQMLQNFLLRIQKLQFAAQGPVHFASITKPQNQNDFEEASSLKSQLSVFFFFNESHPQHYRYNSLLINTFRYSSMFMLIY